MSDTVKLKEALDECLYLNSALSDAQKTIEQLREEVGIWKQERDLCHRLYKQLDAEAVKLRSQNEQLQRELEAAKKDSERMDWLGARLAHPHYWQDLVFAWDHEDGIWLSTVERGEWQSVGTPLEVTSPKPTIREAIDAAARATETKA